MRIYRASSLGYSLCQLVAPHLGFEPLPTPDWLQEKYDEGTALEQPIIEQLRGNGWQIHSQQEEVEIEVIPGVAIVQGHLDGIGKHSLGTNGSERVIEIKTMASSTFEKVTDNGWDTGGIIEKYKWQVSVYMLATGLSATLVAYDKGDGDIWFLDASEPFYTISDIANKLSQAESHIAAGTIPDGCTDYPCPFVYLHGDKEEPDPADPELDGLLAAWLEADKHEKAYKGEKKALRDSIVEYVGEISGKVKGSQGVRVTTDWVPDKEVSYKVAGHWETRITAPKRGRDGTDN